MWVVLSSTPSSYDCGQFWSCKVSRALPVSSFCDLVVDENKLSNTDVSKIAMYVRQLKTLLVTKMHQDNRSEVGRSKNSRNRKKQSHEHISLPMAKKRCHYSYDYQLVFQFCVGESNTAGFNCRVFSSQFENCQHIQKGDCDHCCKGHGRGEQCQ